MNEDRISGSAKRLKGNIKQNIGEVTGDAKLKSEGRADAIIGSAQNILGSIRDVSKSAIELVPPSTKANLKKGYNVVRTNPAITAAAVATAGGIATWYATRKSKA